MNIQERYNFILDVLRLFSLDETDCYSALFWRCDETGTMFFVNVNDVFFWATADVEPITPEDLPAMRQALADVRQAAPGQCIDAYEGLKLWAARKRKMRPQQPAYPKDKRLWRLFDECGPVRTPKEEG